MSRVKHIEINLEDFKLVLQFNNANDPLILHFNTPSRKFYLSLIALIVYEMKQQDGSESVYLRKHETQLKLLDHALAGTHTSGTLDGMWEKIRKAWQYSLPNLEEAPHFKIINRDLIPPYEKGGKYTYKCSEYECDVWANLFEIDDITRWRFRFAVDTAGISSTDVTLTYGQLQDSSAWKAYLNEADKSSGVKLSTDNAETRVSSATIKQRPWILQFVMPMVMVLIVLTGVILISSYFQSEDHPTQETKIKIPSIVVLPFSNTSDDPDKDFFCDGITEDLISNLARVKKLRVISSTSSFYYKNKDIGLRTIGQSLNVDHAVEGSVRVSGDRVRVSAKLIRIADDSHLWADSYDFLLGDLFSIIDEINIKILTEIQVKIGGGDVTRGLAKGANSVEAFLKCMQGLHFQQEGTSATNFQSEMFYREAIRIDPNYATPYIMLANVNLNKIINLLTDNPDSTLKQAFELARKGMSIDPENPEGYLALGRAYQHAGQADKAKETYKRCIELNPNYARSYFLLGLVYFVSMQPEMAIPLYKKALELDPLIFPRGLPASYMAMGRYDEAIEDINDQLRRYPNHPLLITQIIACYAGIDNLKKSRYYATKLLTQNPNFSISKWKKSRDFINPDYVRNFADLMRKAGLPD